MEVMPGLDIPCLTGPTQALCCLSCVNARFMLFKKDRDQRGMVLGSHASCVHCRSWRPHSVQSVSTLSPHSPHCAAVAYTQHGF